MKKAWALLTAVLLLVSATGCGGTGSDQTSGDSQQGASAASYKVGIVQYMEHNALDAATQGFQDALKEKLGDDVAFDVQNAQGEATNCTTIASKFVNDGVDLILANATPAAQAAAQATGDIPIIGTDYVSAGLVKDDKAPGGNVTGTSDLNPIKEQVSLLKTLCPDVQTVGILYCSAEKNSEVQVELATEEFEAQGITVQTYAAADSNELQSVVTKAASENDALYIPTDNLLANNMEIVKNITVPEKVPVICGEENSAMVGGLASYSIDYYKLGYKAGEQAYEILVNGADPATMPIGYMEQEDLKVVINEEIAAEIGVTIPEDLSLE
ncbi:ABC transporter substrate-binding protein [uncultured Ruthenibacterium sp.]|uniref:ABC transporter substrate-binding protein n=1 Tax=uncultured Ruthenibacterium sp. TaxID=1905347 RepID=UPI00349E6B2B